MMEINLLPHVPTSHKYKYQIAVVVGIVVILFSAFIGFQLWHKNNVLEDKKLTLERLIDRRGMDTQELQQQQFISKLVVTYQNEYKRLKAVDIDWVPLIDQISKQLPKDAVIMQMNWSDEGIINMAGDFASLKQVGQYIQLLSDLEWIEEVQFVNAQSAMDQQAEAPTSRVRVFINVKMNPENLYGISDVESSLFEGGDKKND